MFPSIHKIRYGRVKPSQSSHHKMPLIPSQSSNCGANQSSFLEHQSWIPYNERWISSPQVNIILLKFTGEEIQRSLYGIQLWCSRNELWFAPQLLDWEGIRGILWWEDWEGFTRPYLILWIDGNTFCLVLG